MLGVMDAQHTMLRIMVAIAATIAATAFTFSFFPGMEVYRDATFIETRPVVEHWNWLLGILVVYLAPGAIVWRAPRISYALLWSVWTIAVTVLVFVATFDLGDWSTYTIVLWPQVMFGYLMFALVFLLIAVMPIACGVYWWVTREAPTRPQLPVARVLKFRA